MNLRKKRAANHKEKTSLPGLVEELCDASPEFERLWDESKAARLGGNERFGLKSSFENPQSAVP
jgi:hypothetical protein